MNEVRTVFVDVDTQRDFLDPNGALYVPGAAEIVTNLQRLTEYARGRGIPIIATADAHRQGDAEFQVFPPHCVKGTAGQLRIPQTAHPAAAAVPPDQGRDAAALLLRDGAVVIEKQQYDAFSNCNMDRLIEALGRAEYVVYGVATDYCVKKLVLGLLDRGRQVTVVTDAIRPVDAEQGAVAVAEFQRRGARLATVAEVCGQ